MTTTDIVFRLCNTILAGQSAQSIKQAEKELQIIESSPFFVYANMALLFAESSPLTLKQYVATYLSSFINRLLQKDKPSLETCSQNLEKFLIMIRSPLLQLEVKLLLKTPISELVHFLVDKGEQRTTRNQKFFKLILDAQRNKDGGVDFAFIAIYAQAYACKEIHNQKISELVKQVFPLLCKLALRAQQSALIRHPASRKQLPNILDILKEYSQLIRLYSHKFFNLTSETLAKFDFLIIEQLLVSALEFTSPTSVSGSFLYTYVPGDEQTSTKINVYKANYLSVFSSVLKIHSQQQHKLPIPAFSAINELVSQVFGSTAELLRYQRYFQLKQDHMLHYLLDKVIAFLYWCCKYQQSQNEGIFRKISGELIERVIFHCLDFSPKDLQLLHEEDEGEHFISNIESITFCLHDVLDNAWSDDYEKSSRFQTIKSTSAAILSLLCKIDKALLEYLISTASEVIKKKERPHVTRMLLILCIIGPLCDEEPFLSQLVTIFEGISLEIEDFQPGSYEELEFALLIKCVSHLDCVFEAIEKDKNKLADVGINILLSPYCKSSSIRRLAIHIFQSIARQLNQSGTEFDCVMLTIYNTIIPLADGCLVYILEQYQNIFYSMNTCPEIFQQASDGIMHSKQIHQGIKLISELVEKQLLREKPREDVIEQVWKIYESIREVQGIQAEIVTLIQETLLTLLNYADLARDIEFQTKIYSIIISIIKQNEKMNGTQLDIIKTIPRFFYSKNKRRFDGVLEIVLLFLDYYKEPQDLVYEFLKMALDEMTSVAGGLGDEDYGCEGVLVLQSIATQKTSQLKKEHWQQIILTTLKSLEVVSPSEKLYFTNLIALLALALAYSYNHFSEDQNQLLITRILSSLPSFDIGDHASEAMIFALSQLLEIPDYHFVGVRFRVILEALIDLFEQNINYRFQYHEPKTKYSNNLRLLKGPIKDVGYYSFFGRKIKKMKLSKLPIFQKNFVKLTIQKQNYFNEHILGKKPAADSNKKTKV